MHLVGILLSTLCFVNSALAQTDQVLPAMGGIGGGEFVARCQQGEILTGVELRTGDDVDAIRPICVVAYSPTVGGPRNLYPTSFGGGGGGTVRLLCPDNAIAIAGLEVGYEGEKTTIVNNVHLFCSVAATNQQLPAHPTVVFDGPQIGLVGGGPFTGKDYVPLHLNKESCPAGLVAVGINGRSGIWLDAVGLICGELPLNSSKLAGASPGKSMGRVAVSPTPGPPRSICDAAQDARARNSPAAPSLEAQCVASKPSANGAPAPGVKGLLFYNAANGQGGTARLDGAGKYQFVGGLSGFGAWTHIVGTAGGGVLFYNASTGDGATARIDSAGAYQFVDSIHGFAKGWTHIVSANQGSLLFYNAANGQGGTARLDTAGKYQFVGGLSGFGPWTHIIGTAGGGVLFYNASTGDGGTARIDSAGAYQFVDSIPGFAKGWTLIAGL